MIRTWADKNKAHQHVFGRRVRSAADPVAAHADELHHPLVEHNKVVDIASLQQTVRVGRDPYEAIEGRVAAGKEVHPTVLAVVRR